MIEVSVPAIGQGTSHLGKGNAPLTQEAEALRTGVELGMTLIDTAEIYGSEDLVGAAIVGNRDNVFLVSKVWPTHATQIEHVVSACEESLKRLNTDYLDLYLLHWPEGISDFLPVITGFETLRNKGMIRAWGVSNFNVEQLENLFRYPHGVNCAANQVLYNLTTRDMEREVIPWCNENKMPVMAYSPLGGPGANLLRNPVIERIAEKHDCSPSAVVLAWTVRNQNVVAIPKASSVEHVEQNAQALSLDLTQDELDELEAAHPL